MTSPASSTYDVVKRWLDVTVALVALVVSAPLQGAVALAVRSTLGRPVLFRQARPGRDGRVFTLYKFRTMRPGDRGDGLAADGERLTDLGRLLRRTSLDELPSLVNVVRGDMSLVGPRPLLVRYLDRYTEVQRRRHEVRPGITGLAQTSGRNDLSWDERLELDVRYVDSRSFAVDVRILLATVLPVLTADGVSAPGAATMPEFLGPAGGPAR